MSSSAGDLPWPSTLPHNLSKAAQNCLVKNLAFKYREDHIRVNGVLAACIHTNKLDIMAHKKGVDVGEYAALRASAHPVQRVRLTCVGHIWFRRKREWVGGGSGGGGPESAVVSLVPTEARVGGARFR